AAPAAPAPRARLGPEAREGRVVHVAPRGQLCHHVARDVVGGAPALEAGGQLARAPRLARQKLEGRQFGGLRIQLPGAALSAARWRHYLTLAWPRPAGA